MPSARRICGSSSTTSTRSPRHGRDLREADHHRHAAARACPRPSARRPSPRRSPRATARPSPTPAAVAGGRRAAGTAGTSCSRSSTGMPGPWSIDAQVDPLGTAPASTRTALVRRRPGDARCRRRSRPPARAAPASARDPGQRLGDVEHDRRPGGRAGRRARAARPPRGRPRASTSCSAPVCSRLMSSRLPTRWSSRSVSSSIVSRNSRVASGVQSTSRCSRLVTDALIDASGVRRSCDTAASSAVRSSFASASPAAAATSARSRRRSTATCTWAANERRTSRSSSESRGADDDEHVVAADRHREARRPPVGPARGSPATPRRPSHRRPAAQHRDRVGDERGAELRRRAGAAGPRAETSVPPSAASVSASARARAASAVRRARRR